MILLSNSIFAPGAEYKLSRPRKAPAELDSHPVAWRRAQNRWDIDEGLIISQWPEMTPMAHVIGGDGPCAQERIPEGGAQEGASCLFHRHELRIETETYSLDPDGPCQERSMQQEMEKLLDEDTFAPHRSQAPGMDIQHL